MTRIHRDNAAGGAATGGMGSYSGRQVGLQEQSVSRSCAE